MKNLKVLIFIILICITGFLPFVLSGTNLFGSNVSLTMVSAIIFYLLTILLIIFAVLFNRKFYSRYFLYFEAFFLIATFLLIVFSREKREMFFVDREGMVWIANSVLATVFTIFSIFKLFYLKIGSPQKKD